MSIVVAVALLLPFIRDTGRVRARTLHHLRAREWRLVCMGGCCYLVGVWVLFALTHPTLSIDPLTWAILP